MYWRKMYRFSNGVSTTGDLEYISLLGFLNMNIEINDTNGNIANINHILPNQSALQGAYNNHFASFSFMDFFLFC